ncbi:MAG: sugar transferase [Bacteroidetes bacterium]|nr:MAG: sugar transferase [Bacteroidota bacterium]
MKDLIIRETSKEAFDFIKKHVQVSSPEHLITSTTTAFNIEKQFPKSFKSIVNLKRVNDIRWVNKFFEAVNFKLEDGGLFIGNVETYTLRKKRILKKYPPVINWGVYTVDFFFKRVSPKVWGLKKVYFFITRGNNRVMSKAETLGRLYSCGFEVVDEELINGRLYFLVKKVKEPVFDYNPTYGPLITLKRQGKGGKMIRVYKARTMHAYSEYLQEYVYQQNSLQEGGKFKDDFRITTVGKILRKFWLDELPMIINLLKRDLKIVGVRPLSNHYRSLYPKEFQERRKNYRPGLVPPFYVDLPKDLDEIIESERRYLDAYDKHPFLTDWKYFWKAFNNIVFKRVRSN